MLFRATVIIDLEAPNEDAVDDLIHASVELGGELPDGATVFTMETQALPEKGRS